MKKLIAFLMALALCLSLAAAVFADEADPTIEEGYTVEGEGFTSVVR